MTYSQELIRYIKDPEHPDVNLEELRVVSASQCQISGNFVRIEFTPTVPHCGMSTLIGALTVLKHETSINKIHS